MEARSFSWALAVTTLATLADVSRGNAATCESLLSLKLPNTKITKAEVVPAGPFKFGEVKPTFPPNRAAPQLPAFCRVVGVVRPKITFEVWMPVEGWNGKFQGVGNHGFAGDIPYMDMGPQLVRGYAAAGTDTGHNVNDKPSWMRDKQQLVDYGYRGVHEMTDKSKAVIAAFYGKPPQYSYFNGCSTGGKQGMTEAQRYPTDYNGILVGDPNLSQTHNRAQYVWTAQATFARPETTIPSEKLPLIYKAAIDSCDAVDGLRDGLITDPRQCNFDPGVLLCKAGQDVSACLTNDQVDAVRKVYAGPRNSRTGVQIYPGHAVGSERGWKGFVSGPTLTPTAPLYYTNMIFEKPSWDYRTLNWDKDITTADRKVAAIVNADSPDLSAFRKAGGKIVHYHGLTDNNHTPLASIAYYQAVLTKMGRRGARDNDVASFYRLFLEPGQNGCGGGGDGPSVFDPRPALESWVEKGEAPETMIATKYKDDNPNGAVERTRPLCPFPKQAHWKGTGSIDDAKNFTCK